MSVLKNVHNCTQKYWQYAAGNTQVLRNTQLKTNAARHIYEKKKSTENTANKDIKYWQHYTYWKKNTYRMKTLRITTNEWNIQLLKTHGYWKRWWYSITEHRQVLKTQDNWQHIYWKIQNNWEHTSTENTDNTNIYIYIYNYWKTHIWKCTYWKTHIITEHKHTENTQLLTTCITQNTHRKM